MPVIVKPSVQQVPLLVTKEELPSRFALAVPVSQPELETATHVGEALLAKCASHWLVLSSEFMVRVWLDAPFRVTVPLKVKITPC